MCERPSPQALRKTATSVSENIRHVEAIAKSPERKGCDERVWPWIRFDQEDTGVRECAVRDILARQDADHRIFFPPLVTCHLPVHSIDLVFDTLPLITRSPVLS
jgi:hypothetical protein